MFQAYHPVRDEKGEYVKPEEEVEAEPDEVIITDLNSHAPKDSSPAEKSEANTTDQDSDQPKVKVVGKIDLEKPKKKEKAGMLNTQRHNRTEKRKNPN